MKILKKEIMRMKKLTLSVMLIGIMWYSFGLLIYAAEGTVTVASAKIRQSADANSEMIGSATNGAVYTINSEVTGSDGQIWYQIIYEEGKTGYIRSDLMSKVGESSSATVNTPTSSVASEVTLIQPIGAKVNSAQVRVRENASTSSSIVTTVRSDVVLTATGYATDSESKTWYQVSFSEASGEVSGFVREDFITLEGEVTPLVAENNENTVVDDGIVEEPVVEVKDYDTAVKDDVWFLLNNIEGVQYNIVDLFKVSTDNAKLYEESLGTIKKQKIAVVILVILLTGAGVAITFLIMKIKEISDSAYFEQVEKEVVRKRTTTSSSKSNSKNPVTKNPVTKNPVTKNPVTQKPVTQNPVSKNPAAANQGKVRKATEAGTKVEKLAEKPKTQPIGKAVGKSEKNSVEKGNLNKEWKSKNFITDDDEFEFEFLNWDGDEKD